MRRQCACILSRDEQSVFNVRMGLDQTWDQVVAAQIHHRSGFTVGTLGTDAGDAMVVYRHIRFVHFVGEDIHQSGIPQDQVRLALPASDLNECTSLL